MSYDDSWEDSLEAEQGDVHARLADPELVTSVRIIGGGQVALLNPLETFLTVIWSVLFLSESLTAVQWMGGGLILLSALLAIQRLRRARSVNIGGQKRVSVD